MAITLLSDPWLAVLAVLLGGAAGYLLGRLRPGHGAPARAVVQAAAETQAIGLSLRRLAATPPPAEAVQGLAARLLDVSDHLRDSLAANGRPRRLQEAEVRLLPLLEAAAAQVAAELGDSAPRCRMDASLKAVALRVDPRALRGAVAQVLVRAARLSGPADAVVLRFLATAETVAIVVEDEGAGLGADDLRLPSMADASRGVGFGLVLARSLMRAHGGDLALEAAAGVGSRVWLTLPAARRVADAAAGALPQAA